MNGGSLPREYGKYFLKISVYESFIFLSQVKNIRAAVPFYMFRKSSHADLFDVAESS